jgi:putative aldouronate transport system permease protein
MMNSAKTRHMAHVSWKSDLRRNYSLYLMALPGIVFFFVLSYIPIFFLVVAFQNYKAARGILGSTFVGFKHFQALFTDFMFPTILKNTIVLNLLKIFFCFPMPVILALCFNEMRPTKYKGAMQSIVYLPHFFSWVIIYGIMNSMLNTNNGLINQVIVSLGGKEIPFLSKQNMFRPIMVLSEIWKEAGWGSIVYIAALSSISPELYEASKIDGASRLRQIWHVSLPGIRNTIVILFILSIGSLMSGSFEQVLVLKNSATQGVAEIIPTYVYDKGIVNFKISYASAVGLFQSGIGFVLVVLSNMFAKKMGGNALW